MGFSPGAKKVFTNAWFTIATIGAVYVSCTPIPRPITTCVPTESRYSSFARTYVADLCRFGCPWIWTASLLSMDSIGVEVVDADLHHARNLMEAVLDRLIERAHLRRKVARRSRVEVDDVAVGGIELHVDVLELVEALRKHARADEQNERELPAAPRSVRCSNEALPVVVRVPLRVASAGCAFAESHAGATPKRTPVSSEVPGQTP